MQVSPLPHLPTAAAGLAGSHAASAPLDDDDDGRSAPLHFTPLHASFGAECRGVDFSRPVAPATIRAIRRGMAQYGVLVFRATQLDDAGHEAFARQFGEPDTSAVQPERKYKSLAAGAEAKPYRLAPHMELADVANVDDDGRLLEPASLRAQADRGNSLFHVDCSYNDRRAAFSILRAHRLPPPGTGGNTAFADSRAAYDDLDAATKAGVEDLVLAHSAIHSRALAAPDSIFARLDPAAFPVGRHRLVQRHEPSGRTTLYIAAHAYCVDGKTPEESMPLIRDLLSHASQDKYTFEVAWENRGDMIIWDNTCVMHKACGGPFEGKHVREMRRATVYDDSSSAWGLNKQ